MVSSTACDSRSGGVAKPLLSLLCLSACCADFAAAQTGPSRVPTAAELRAAGDATLAALTDLMVERAGADGDALVDRLLVDARAQDDVAVAYAILLQARRAARKSGSLAANLRVVDAMAERFTVDALSLRLEILATLKGRSSIPELAVAFEYVATGHRHVETCSETALRRIAAALTRLAARSADPRVEPWAAAEIRELEQIRAAWQTVAETEADSPARGEYLCFYRDRWESGRALLDGSPALRRTVADKESSDPDGLTCVRVAEYWLDRARSTAHELVVHNLDRRALHWYRRAWPQLEGLEQERVAAHLSRVEDRVLSRPGLGRVLMTDAAAVDQLVIADGAWRVEDGRLYGRNTGDTATATYRYAYRSIDTVLIRGGIASSPGLNFRLAVGPLNVLFNWEVRPENHFYIGDRACVTAPHALTRGREHEIRVRQLGPDIVVFLDGEAIFNGPGHLSGTVAVYPALRSEIFVTELAIDGEIDPRVVVRAPSHTAR